MKMVLYCSLYPISSEFEAADEIIAKAQHHFGEVKMDFETGNSSNKKLYT